MSIVAMMQNGTKASTREAMAAASLSAADKELLATLSKGEQGVVLWVMANYGHSLAEAIEEGRASGM